VNEEGRVPLVVAIFKSGNAILDKAREPAAKVSAGLKSGCGSYVTHVRPAIANSTVTGTKFRVINSGGEEGEKYPPLQLDATPSELRSCGSC